MSSAPMHLPGPLDATMTPEGLEVAATARAQAVNVQATDHLDRLLSDALAGTDDGPLPDWTEHVATMPPSVLRQVSLTLDMGERAARADAYCQALRDSYDPVYSTGYADGQRDLAAALAGSQRAFLHAADCEVAASAPAPFWPDLCVRCGERERAERARALLVEQGDRMSAQPYTDTYDDGTRRLEVTWADTISPRKAEWAWEHEGHGRIPVGSLSLVTGGEGVGKSSFGIWLAAQITRGALPGAYWDTPRRVLYVAVKDSWECTLVPRLMAAGADLSKVGRVAMVEAYDQETTMSLPADNADLEGAIANTGAALVVIDPLMSLPGDGISASRSREVRRMLDPIVAIASRTGCVVLGIAHHSKGSRTDPIMAVSESKAFTDVPHSVFAFARDKENGCRVISQTKNSFSLDAASLPSLRYNIVPATIPLPGGEVTETDLFELQGVSERSVADLSRDAFAVDDVDDCTEAETWLESYLQMNPNAALAEAKREAHKGGIAERTLKRASKTLGVVSRAEGFPRRTTWSLPIPDTNRATRESAPTTAGLTGSTTRLQGQVGGATGGGAQSGQSGQPMGTVEDAGPTDVEGCLHGAPAPGLCRQCDGSDLLDLFGGDHA